MARHGWSQLVRPIFFLLPFLLSCAHSAAPSPRAVPSPSAAVAPFPPESAAKSPDAAAPPSALDLHWQKLESLLQAPTTPPLQRYYGLSALVALGRAHGEFVRLDRLLIQLQQGAPDEPLSLLAALWWADNALYSLQFKEAETRYQDVMARLDARPEGGLSPVWLLDVPLEEWVLTQWESALAAQGRLWDAAELVALRPARSEQLRGVLRQRAERQAERSNDKRLLTLPQHPPRVFAVPLVDLPAQPEPPPVRPLETVGFRAPWEPGTYQRAGTWGSSPGLIFRAFFRHLFSPESRQHCGPWIGGFYYDVGSHAAKAHSGRDTYAIDFTAATGRKTEHGWGSFGIPLRASAEGIAGVVYYGTPTHKGVGSAGPLYENNRVLLHHLPPGALTLNSIIRTEPMHRRIPWQTHRARGFHELWDYTTGYHHLVGLLDPCAQPRPLSPPRPCIPIPARVSTGQYVWQGTVLGFEDSTGYSFSDHLHFQINQSCRAAPGLCTTPRHRLTGMSRPMHLEGRWLTAEDLGACLLSSNEDWLWEALEGDGLPAPLEVPGVLSPAEASISPPVIFPGEGLAGEKK